MNADAPSVSGTGTPRVVLSVDAMGGDKGPAAVIAGLFAVLKKNADVDFLLHGPEAELASLLKGEDALASRITVCHAEGRVTMEDKPSTIMRNGKGTSMWSAIESVKDGRAQAVVSCGNTGALMALSMLILRRIEGVKRPAIACLWPSRNPQGFNIMLDVGADVRAEGPDLAAFALMGASFARNGLGLAKPRIGLLNVGTEENKGSPEVKEGHEMIAAAESEGGYSYVGFVEGSDIPSARVDVIVTDGFTGNVALKTAEGTAVLIRELLRQSFAATLLARFAALLAWPSLKRLSHRIDPRRANGGLFLGLNGTVVKSHGGSDATAIEAAVTLALRLARSDFANRLAARLASSTQALQDGTTGANLAAGGAQ